MNPVFLSILNLIRGQAGEVFPVSNFDSSLILDKITDIQISIETLAIHDGPIASAHVILLAAGVVIFLGVAGEAFFKKTGIPDVAFLMVLGVIIGPVFGIIQPEAVIQVVPYFAALALIIIMFDGGLNLDITACCKNRTLFCNTSYSWFYFISCNHNTCCSLCIRMDVVREYLVGFNCRWK